MSRTIRSFNVEITDYRNAQPSVYLYNKKPPNANINALAPFNKYIQFTNTHHHKRHFCQADSEDSDGSITTSHQQPIKSGTPGPHVKSTRSASSDSSTSESSGSSAAVRNTGATYTTQEVKQKLVQSTPVVAATPAATATSATRTRPVETTPTTEKKPFQSRFLPNHQVEKKEETESSSEEETSSEESEEEEEEEEDVAKPAAKTTPAAAATAANVSSVLARTTQARDAPSDNNRRSSRDDTTLRGGYSTPTYNRSYEREPSPKYTPRTRPTRDQYEEPSKYGSTASTGSSG